METVIQAIEVFAAITGVVYVILEILQKNSMWWVGILTGAACAFSFGVQHVWASMGLNIYYMAMSVWGLYQWKKAGTQVGEGEIHLRERTAGVNGLSGGLFVFLTSLLVPVLRVTGDPAPFLDALAVSLSIIGTWWLAQSYLDQWLVWIAADILSTALCIHTGQYWMAALYLVYTGSAVYGYIHWKNHGKYVPLKD